MNKLFTLTIFAALILSTFQEKSPEISSFEILIGGILVTIFFVGTFRFITSFRSFSKPLIYLLGFSMWATINIIIALANNVEILWWFRRFFPIITLPLIILVSITTFRSSRQIRQAYIMLIFIGIIIVLQAMIQIHSVYGLTSISLQELRKYGGGYYSAFTLCLVSPFLFGRQNLSLIKKLLAIITVTVSLLGLVLSFTRTYWISTAIALLFMMYLFSKGYRKFFPRYFVPTALVGGLVVTIILLITPLNIKFLVISRIATIPKATRYLSFQDRIKELEGLWNTIAKRPITILVGNGLGSKFKFYSVNPFSWDGVGWIQNDYSHNYFAYLLWSTGIIGLSLFLLFWGSLLHRATKLSYQFFKVPVGNHYYLIGACMAIVNLLVASLAAPPLMNFKWPIYFGILIGLTINLIRLHTLPDRSLIISRKEITHS